MTGLPTRPGLRRVEFVMGTPVSLDLADDLPAPRLAALADLVFDWLREVDRRFSTYRPQSEVCRLGRGALPATGVSADLRRVLADCADLWAATDGFFDVYATGRLDPSGYVKGWAAQVASDRLVAQGAPNHCLNAGGDVRARGRSSSGRPWRIGVQHPWDPTTACWVITGTDLAVATSGVYERGHHVVDPRRGAVARGLRSVTVVGTDLGTADAYATAAVAMGTAGPGWLDRLSGYQHAVVTDEGRAVHSPGFPLADRTTGAGPGAVPAGNAGGAGPGAVPAGGPAAVPIVRWVVAGVQ